jgi:hypothetical protein
MTRAGLTWRLSTREWSVQDKIDDINFSKWSN